MLQELSHFSGPITSGVAKRHLSGEISCQEAFSKFGENLNLLLKILYKRHVTG